MSQHHVDQDLHAEQLQETARMLTLAENSLGKRPLSTADVAWAKGCLECATHALGTVLDATHGALRW